MRRRYRDLLRGKDVQEVAEMKRVGNERAVGGLNGVPYKPQVFNTI